MKIRIGIAGYGNLGRGMEYAVAQNPDMELRCILTRRDPSALTPITPGVETLSAGETRWLAGEVDVMVLCGGSAADLPAQTPEFARLFNVVDSFDTHAKIPEHFEAVDRAAKSGGKTAVISAGWDPGLFSLNRLLAEAVLPRGGGYTFWGKGVSQGHSDAIRRIDGVLDARQYTVPAQSALDAARSGQSPDLSVRQKHTRECYVVAAEGADRSRIEREIVTMPHYFAEYDTTVRFISAEELAQNHAGMPHGGFVIRGGKTGDGGRHSQMIEFGLRLDSNPEFTASVLAACARAAYRLNREGVTGCKTLFDIPPACLSAQSGEELRRTIL
ncbi:MAG: diaminopimelate dehydrogenase [Oscillospiraceae bacterium]|nr:diaminopimelate dehydrogenase [Oscillospiraceae bacterium]